MFPPTDELGVHKIHFGMFSSSSYIFMFLLEKV